MSHVKRNHPDGSTAIQQSAGRYQTLPGQSVTSPANDNDNKGSWPMPLPEGFYPSFSSGDVETPRRFSWKAKLVKLAYIVAAPVAGFGWLYVLWLAIVSSVMWILD